MKRMNVTYYELTPSIHVQCVDGKYFEFVQLIRPFGFTERLQRLVYKFEWKKIGNRKYLTIKGLKTFITYLKNSASRKNGLFNKVITETIIERLSKLDVK